MKMLKYNLSLHRLCSVMLFLLPNILFAQTGVNTDELNTAAGIVDFENNSNHPDVINTNDEIRQIGMLLAKNINDSQGKRIKNIRIGALDRYSLIEVVGRPSEDGLSADVIELGYNAGVDHIRNLRTIISGYLEYAYGYTQEEADELAVLITVYNAVNRKNINRFTKNYQKSVASRLDKNKVGLAVSFKEWPGKTQLVIPLYSPAQNDNYQISVEAIVEEKEVKAALEKEVVKVDVERALREQKAREDAAKQEEAAAKKRAEEEKLSHEQNARRAAQEAANRADNLRRAIAAAIERLRQETERLKYYEDEIVQTRSEAEKARRQIVRNKFGVPLAGNETAMEKDALLANQEKLIERQGALIENVKNELAELEQQLGQAQLDAAEAVRYAKSIGLDDINSSLEAASAENAKISQP
jgi:hypothetical protein